MRSTLGIGLVLLASGVAGAAVAQDGPQNGAPRDRPAFRLPQQPDFSNLQPDRREPDRRVHLRTGPQDNRRAEHLAFGGQSAEARLRDLGVRDGARFGDRGRLYLFAADGETAVGYNLTHGDDGWSRDGLSIDAGAFMGDAQAGIAWRQGDFQTSFGYVQRTIEKEGRIGRNLDEDIVALHVSFVPGR